VPPCHGASDRDRIRPTFFGEDSIVNEKTARLASGWGMLPITLLALPALIVAFVANAAYNQGATAGVLGVALVLAGVAWVVHLFGYIVINPNEARVIQLFGDYVGTLSETGFYYGNPFYTKTKISMRVQTFETGMSGTAEVKNAEGKVLVPASSHRQPSKVNDKDGTPIEIAAVVVWRVVSPAAAVLQVAQFQDFVHLQSDAALRNLASRYSYDAPEADEHSLRGHIDAVAQQLKVELQERMTQAGVEIQDARISYLAYAPEIAAAMLQRQQAGALIAARARIVEGAVGMVEHAMQLLEQKNVVQLDADRRATLVSNLLVVLCSHSAPQPVINASGHSGN
jgi:regulator of protease activity HflC (stomatin/prohibitin superfamily)